MGRTIALTFTAAALLMAAGLALNSYGREIFEGGQAAAEELPRFSIPECYGGCGEMESWEKAAGVAWLLALAVFIAGAMLWQAETPAPTQRILVLGLNAGAPRRVARAASPVVIKAHANGARLPRLHDDEGLTTLERVIRGR